jgi:predicted XRE-type DNA-binding protein
MRTLDVMGRRIAFSDQIRRAIETAPVSRYRISQETEISQGQLCRFMQADVGLSIEALDRLAEYLGLMIEVKPPRQRKGR